MNFLEALINAIRLPELRNKILFTGGILIVFRLFANIAIPGAKQSALSLLFNQQALLGLLDLFSGGGLSDYVPFIIFGVIALLMTAVIIEVQQAVRKIPIQSAQRVAGGREVGRRASFLPLRVNHAGVIPIIFAISVMFLPTIVANYFNAAPPDTWYYRAAHWIQGT